MVGPDIEIDAARILDLLDLEPFRGLGIELGEDRDDGEEEEDDRHDQSAGQAGLGLGVETDEQKAADDRVKGRRPRMEEGEGEVPFLFDEVAMGEKEAFENPGDENEDEAEDGKDLTVDSRGRWETATGIAGDPSAVYYRLVEPGTRPDTTNFLYMGDSIVLLGAGLQGLVQSRFDTEECFRAACRILQTADFE